MDEAKERFEALAEKRRLAGTRKSPDRHPLSMTLEHENRRKLTEIREFFGCPESDAARLCIRTLGMRYARNR